MLRVQQSGPQTPFETFCPQCRVTFAIGTRRCVHCGQRLGGARVQPRAVAPASLEDGDPEELGGRRGMLSPMTGIWIMLALFGALYRVCSG